MVRLSFLKSKHAPFFLFSLTNNVDLPLKGSVTHVGATSYLLRGSANSSARSRPAHDPHYFLGASAGAAGAGVAAGAAGAGASAGLASSLAAGFSGTLGLHAMPMAAKLITKTSASKSKIHRFTYLHLLSNWFGSPPLFLPEERAFTPSGNEIWRIARLNILGSTGFLTMC